MKTLPFGLSAAALLALGNSAQAQLLGATVNGSLSVDGGSNMLTPTSAVVVDPGIEFSVSNQITVDFTDSGLSLLITGLNPGAGFFSETYMFTSPALVGLSVTEVGDTFPAPGLTPSLVGDTLTLSIPFVPTAVGVSSLSASYRFTGSAVPEPGSLALLCGLGTSAGPLLRKRRKAA